MSVVLSFFCYQSLQLWQVALDGGVPEVLLAAEEPLAIHFSQFALEGSVVTGHIHLAHDKTLEGPMERKTGRVDHDVLQVQDIVYLTIQEVPIIESLLEMSSEQRLHLQWCCLVLVSEEEVECLYSKLFDVFRAAYGPRASLSLSPLL